jgi:Tfp pilus assembly protein PilV
MKQVPNVKNCSVFKLAVAKWFTVLFAIFVLGMSVNSLFASTSSCYSYSQASLHQAQENQTVTLYFICEECETEFEKSNKDLINTYYPIAANHHLIDCTNTSSKNSISSFSKQSFQSSSLPVFMNTRRLLI